MFIKKNILFLSFFFALSVQASQPIPFRTTIERNGTTKQVSLHPNDGTWMRETRITDFDGKVILEEWEEFPTKEEAEGRRLIIQKNDDSDSDDEERGMGKRTESVMDFDAFGEIDEPKPKKASSKSSLQPVQSSHVQKIHVSDSQIPRIAQQIQDLLVFEFTGRMTPEEIVVLMERNNLTNYDDVSLRKISEKISHALQDLDGLADVMYRLLQQQPNFNFRPKDNDQAKERYFKNYLHQYAGKYVSNDLAQALKNRFLYKKLKPDESLKYAKELYFNLMQDSKIDWFKDSKKSLKAEAVRKIVLDYLQNSTDSNIAEIRKRLPSGIIQDNPKVLDDINDIIDWTTKKIALPVNRPSEDLGKKLEDRAKALRPDSNKQ